MSFRPFVYRRSAAVLISIALAISGSAGAAGQEREPPPSNVQASLVTVPPEVPADAQRFSVPLAVLDPTVSVFEDLFVGRTGKFAPTMEPMAGRLPPQIRRSFLAVGLPVPDGMDQRFRDSYQAMLRLLKKLHDSGVTIVAGTDDLPGFTLHRELANYVAAGIPPARALQLATIVPARVMKREKISGSIAPEKAADLILVDGDPTTRISDIRRVAIVIKDGAVYDAAALYRALGVSPGELTVNTGGGSECPINPPLPRQTGAEEQAPGASGLARLAAQRDAALEARGPLRTSVASILSLLESARKPDLTRRV